jgi:stringent starvation protein A
VPTLVDRDLTIYESRIIMEYLDERFPHPPLMPADPVARANIRLYLHRVDREWLSQLPTIAAGGKEADRARQGLLQSLLDSARLFGAKPFFLSEDITLADCAIAPLLWRLPRLGMEIPAQAKAIHDYQQRLFARPGFRASLSEEEREMRE